MSETENQNVDETANNKADSSQDEAQQPESQGELGDAGKKALDSERRARREAEKAAKEADSRREELEAELEKARADAEEAAAARRELEHAALIREVADEYGLTGDVVEFLTGADREELEAKAEKLKAFAGPRRPAPVPEIGAGGKLKRSTAEQFGDAMEELLG